MLIALDFVTVKKILNSLFRIASNTPNASQQGIDKGIRVYLWDGMLRVRELNE